MLSFTTILLGMHLVGAGVLLVVAGVLVWFSTVKRVAYTQTLAHLLVGGVLFETATGLALAVASGISVWHVCDNIALYIIVCGTVLAYAHGRTVQLNGGTLLRPMIATFIAPSLLTGGALLAGF